MRGRDEFNFSVNIQFAQVTLDHTVARRNHDAGTPTPDGHIAHHLLTSSVRSGDISVCTLEHGTLLVCTNTVHNQVPLGQLASELAGMTDPRATADRLAEALRRRVDRDGVVLAIHPSGAPPALLSTTAPAAARTAAASFPTGPNAPASTSAQTTDTVSTRITNRTTERPRGHGLSECTFDGRNQGPTPSLRWGV